MNWKALVFRLLGKDPDAVVVSFCSGSPELAERMVAEVRGLVPDREHYAVTDVPMEGVRCVKPTDLPGPLRRKRIGLAPTLFTGEPEYRPMRWLAFRMAPFKLLAYNRALERHHLQLRTLLASLLFLKGVRLDRIWLRPRWFPFRRESSTWPETHTVFEGRSASPSRRSVAILTPYFPYPLSHGGAVRIFNLLREAARHFDVFLFAFSETSDAAKATPVLDHCVKVILFPNPRYRDPRWASLTPPEVREFYTIYVDSVISDFCTRYRIGLLQTEYTHMAAYSGDLLVEHDITFDLYRQINEREHTLGSWWDFWRWRRWELKALKPYRRVVVMSQKDADLLPPDMPAAIIPNGVDLERFRPEPEQDGERLLFVGSFAHFPNAVACRWFVSEIWPLITAARPNVRLTIIAGRNSSLYWTDPILDRRIELHDFISDVRPFYAECNVVVVPTRVSAGTNLKVLEALAMGRAVVSTTSGCAGLNLLPGESVIVANDPAGFANAILNLVENPELRRVIASAGLEHVRAHYGWDRIGALQRALWNETLGVQAIRVRPGTRRDLPEIRTIQLACHRASQWDPDAYFSFDLQVAEHRGDLSGFMVSRTVGPGEVEVLNLAVAPEARRQGIATALLESIIEPEVFLEVRESNLAAQSLYRKLGFDAVGRRERYYDDPVENALVMRRSRQA